MLMKKAVKMICPVIFFNHLHTCDSIFASVYRSKK